MQGAKKIVQKKYFEVNVLHTDLSCMHRTYSWLILAPATYEVFM